MLNRLSQLGHEAQQKGPYSTAVRCEELIGKAMGMFVDRQQQPAWDGDLKKLTDEQLQLVGDSLLLAAYRQAEQRQHLQSRSR